MATKHPQKYVVQPTKRAVEISGTRPPKKVENAWDVVCDIITLGPWWLGQMSTVVIKSSLSYQVIYRAVSVGPDQTTTHHPLLQLSFTPFHANSSDSEKY